MCRYNPMVIMSLVSVGIMFVMPKMMANMDPEQLKEMQEMQKGGMMEMLTNPEKAKERLAEASKPAGGGQGKRAAAAAGRR